MDWHYVIELVKSIRNRCEIFLWRLDFPEDEHLAPTILEDILVDAQDAVDEVCVVREPPTEWPSADGSITYHDWG